MKGLKFRIYKSVINAVSDALRSHKKNLKPFT